MASSAGQQLVAGRIPGEIIGMTTVTADTSTFTTETIVASITVPLVSGRTYSIQAQAKFASSVDDDDVTALLREDNTSGTALQSDRNELSTDNQGSFGQTFHLLAFYTAVATANKTFVLTGARDAGTGNIRLEAAATRPTLLIVRYESG